MKGKAGPRGELRARARLILSSGEGLGRIIPSGVTAEHAKKA